MGVSKKQSTPNFSKNEHFLPPDTPTFALLPTNSKNKTISAKKQKQTNKCVKQCVKLFIVDNKDTRTTCDFTHCIFVVDFEEVNAGWVKSTFFVKAKQKTLKLKTLNFNLLNFILILWRNLSNDL